MHPVVVAIYNNPQVIVIINKAVGGGVHSTLGTMSNLDNYLRLLFVRVGVRIGCKVKLNLVL